MLVLASCRNGTPWAETAENSALALKEQQIDPVVAHWQDRWTDADLAALTWVEPRTRAWDRGPVFVTSGPAWQGIALPPDARLILEDRTARGEYALFHVSQSSTAVTAALRRQLEAGAWHPLERLSSTDSRGYTWEYFSFWRDQLSFLPQQYFTTACALVQAGQAPGLTTLEMGTRCADLRQAALNLGFAASSDPLPEGWTALDLGALSTHVPHDGNSSRPFSRHESCTAPGAFLCMDQYSLERNDSTLTLRLLVGGDATAPLALHPAQVLQVSQSLAEGALPLLIQPVVTQGGVEGIQLYSWLAGTATALRSELHFLRDRQYWIFEGTLTGQDFAVLPQAPLLSQVMRGLKAGAIE